MRLQKNGEEFDLEFTIGTFMALKKELKTDNLRKALLRAAEHEEFQVLAQALCAFSGKRLARAEDAYAVMDAYLRESGESAYEMFIALITEAGEAGFFKERLTRQEVREQARSPELGLDMEELTAQAMARFKDRLLDQMVEQASGTMGTGASILPTSSPPLTVVG